VARSTGHSAAAKAKPLRVIQTRATWYGPGFHGRRTASGERFNQHAMTLASRHLPFGTRVRVVNPKNGKSVVGRVNDRGPFVRGYGVDLSRAMARKLGLNSGPVRVEVLPRGK
jgi:rare lipoprotein A